MFKTRSYKLVDAIVNHPDVRPTIEKGSYRIQTASLISDSHNLIYAGEDGVVMFLYDEPGIYKLHAGFLKSARGKSALAATKECLADIFTRFEASLVTIAVPLQLRSARLFCRMLGAERVGADDDQEFFVLEGGSQWAA